jgi:hypothetical protein
MELNISDAMRKVLLKAVNFAILRKQNFEAADGEDYVVDLEDAKALLEVRRAGDGVAA